MSYGVLSFKQIFLTLLLLQCYLTVPSLGSPLETPYCKIILFFSSPVSQEQSGWVPPKMKQKPSNAYHPLHFITETLVAAHIECSSRLTHLANQAGK